MKPLWGCTSPIAPFLCSDVKSYGKEKYSVIHFSYSFNIHCFNGKELWYTSKKLEYTRIILIIVYYAMNISYRYSYLYYWESFLLLYQYVYIYIDYCMFLSIDCIDIYRDMLYCYNIVTMYYIVITVYYISKNSDKVYRYKDVDIISNMAY